MKFGNFFYNATFALCVLLTAVSVAGSAAGIVFQAKLAQGQVANWNVFIVVGCYVALGIEALIIFLNRRHTGRKKLSTIPKPYIAVKQGDVPKDVAQMISREYTRNCIIMALSRPNKGTHPGWGAPGSKYDGMRFREAILDTIPDIDSLARTFLPELLPLRPHRPMIEHLKPLDFVLLQDDSQRLGDYHELVEMARFDDAEPTEDDWERCKEIVDQMKSILTFYINAESSNGNGHPPSESDDQTHQSFQSTASSQQSLHNHFDIPAML
ncbi:hypothetical protein FRB95_001980 [Tulasnella sp. JGI-2019a]|nr:hypothetical protein FRB95_001980 [Tulasnella sp. JGI-2019a]